MIMMMKKKRWQWRNNRREREEKQAGTRQQEPPKEDKGCRSKHSATLGRDQLRVKRRGAKQKENEERNARKRVDDEQASCMRMRPRMRLYACVCGLSCWNSMRVDYLLPWPPTWESVERLRDFSALHCDEGNSNLRLDSWAVGQWTSCEPIALASLRNKTLPAGCALNNKRQNERMNERINQMKRT